MKQKHFPEEKIIVDFTNTKKPLFDIKSESSYNAYLSKGSLALGLKKPNCIAWVDMPGYEYQDHIIEAKFSLDSLGGYAAAGLIFRLEEQESYYMALISSKGYFRLDVVKDNIPRTLIAWTEFTNFDETNINLNVITYGTYLIFIVNGKWLGEASDDSLRKGRLGLAAASYDSASGEAADKDEYTCKVRLDYLAVDPRVKIIEEAFKKWTDDANINAESRLRLAETFAVMGEASKSLDQINRAWKRRDDAIRTIAADYTEIRTRKELLLAARMAFRLEQYNEAEEFINAIMDQLADDQQKLADLVEAREALTEKIRILSELNKFEELKNFALKYNKFFNKNIDFYTTLARCYWELKEYKDSAKAWDKAFSMKKENGVYAANAGNALELAGEKEEALARFMKAGKLFLNQNNMPEITALLPKLTLLGENNWEARVLAGKCAFSIEDYTLCETEFAIANKLRRTQRPRPKADPAQYYLWALVLNIRGKNSSAIRMLERAVKLAPEYGLFRFKLAEIKLTSGKKGLKTADQKIAHQELVEELKLALRLIGSDPKGKMANHAGTLLLNSGDPKNAKYFFDKAKRSGT